MSFPVRASARPLTASGVAGPRPQTAGSGRQVKDSNYFRNLLKLKLCEISAALDAKSKEEIRLRSSLRSVEDLGSKANRLRRDLNQSLNELRDINRCIDVLESKDSIAVPDEQVLKDKEARLESLLAERNMHEQKLQETNSYLSTLESSVQAKLFVNTGVASQQLATLKEIASQIGQAKAQNLHNLKGESERKISETREQLEADVVESEAHLDSIREEISVLSLPIDEQRDRVISLINTINMVNQKREEELRSIESKLDETNVNLQDIKIVNPDILLMQRKYQDIESFLKSFESEAASLRQKLEAEKSAIQSLSQETQVLQDADAIACDCSYSERTIAALRSQVGSTAQGLEAISAFENLYADELSRLEQLLTQQRNCIAALTDISQCEVDRARKNIIDSTTVGDASKRVRDLQSRLYSGYGELQLRKSELEKHPLHARMVILEKEIHQLKRKLEDLQSLTSDNCDTHRQKMNDLVSQINESLNND